LLDQNAAVTESRVEAVGHLVALDIVLLTEFAALDELEDPGETADILSTGKYQAVVVDTVIALKTWVPETFLLLAVDEPRAESCFQAEMVVGLETPI